jgi:hypothetical protein
VRRINWPLWTGFLLCIAAFVSYFAFFARFPITRDVPWLTYLLFLMAVALLVMGVGRARSKVVAGIVAMIGLLFLGGFTYFVFVFAKKLPASAGAPRVGSPAPDFTLKDSAGGRFSLASSAAAAPKGLLLIFYRGYW